MRVVRPESFASLLIECSVIFSPQSDYKLFPKGKVKEFFDFCINNFRQEENTPMEDESMKLIKTQKCPHRRTCKGMSFFGHNNLTGFPENIVFPMVSAEPIVFISILKTLSTVIYRKTDKNKGTAFIIYAFPFVISW